jgi:hypothetical protein
MGLLGMEFVLISALSLKPRIELDCSGCSMNICAMTELIDTKQWIWKKV